MNRSELFNVVYIFALKIYLYEREYIFSLKCGTIDSTRLEYRDSADRMSVCVFV